MRSSPSQVGGYKALGVEQLEAVAGLFAVLSEPSRLRILQALQDGETGVGELVEGCGMKQANVSKQLNVLAAAGVVGRRQEGNRVIYRIAMPMVAELCAVVCDGVARHAAERAKRLSPQKGRGRVGKTFDRGRPRKTRELP